MEVEHKLTDMAYGVGRYPTQGPDGSVVMNVLLKFGRHDGSESWLIPLSEKAAEEIADLLVERRARIKPASVAELKKLG